MIENNKKIKELRQKALALPLLPGVYIMRDESGEIIYIGKAKKLKNRVVQYFRNIRAHLPKVYQMVIRVNDFEHILCDSEFEALVLECNLIKQHTPKYNILLKDDKGYHYVKISAGDFPKISSAKQSDALNCKDGSKFIGPYMSAFAVKQMVDDANKLFRLPTCSRKFPRDFGKKRPCLRHHIGHCSGVCSGRITAEEYAANFSEALKFIKGNGEIDIPELERQMLSASEALDFELAARLRDRIFAAKKIKEEQKIFLNTRVNCDVVALSAGERKCCICVIKYRKGRLCDSSQHIFDSQPPYNEMLSQFLAQYYMEGEDIPREIYLNLTLEDRALIEKLLCERSGKNVKISTPQKNERYRLVILAQNNAAEGLAALSKSSGKEIAALDELSRLLSLESPPEYIESYDISNLGDRHIVGGMVVFKNGRPLRSAYKKFTIKDQLVQDDYSAMRQMLRRRFTEYLNSEKSDEGFGKLPDLILLDGGKGHVGAVMPVLEELGISTTLFGMVKDSKHRTRAITNGQEIAISSNRAAFTLVSKIQDEVHRYTISFQQNKHKKASLV
ncbi:MAG: excinuclease ABC subunit UvrC, partial [Oscillospiraceae bacterium]|nr:excinuclease ABC subunit UvrC [Oscillospiraceae bacterium]